MSAGNTSEKFNPMKRAGGLFDEFKAFAFKGNVIDLALGVIIGAAFTAIVNSMVKGIIMPIISIIVPGEKSYEKWSLVINQKEILVGQFLAAVLNFLILALVLFLFIKKFLGWVMRAKQQEVVAPPPPTKQEELLMEIRDLLKQQAT